MKAYKFIRDDHIIDLTPGWLAHVFAGMNSDDQAEFFTQLAIETNDWQDGGLPFQLQYVTDSEFLTSDGRAVMALIGDYAAPSED